MKSSDRKLGMGAAISRRDLIHGIAATALGAAMTRSGASEAAAPIAGAATYPPCARACAAPIQVRSRLRMAAVMARLILLPSRPVKPMTLLWWAEG